MKYERNKLELPLRCDSEESRELGGAEWNDKSHHLNRVMNFPGDLSPSKERERRGKNMKFSSDFAGGLQAALTEKCKSEEFVPAVHPNKFPFLNSPGCNFQ